MTTIDICKKGVYKSCALAKPCLKVGPLTWLDYPGNRIEVPEKPFVSAKPFGGSAAQAGFPDGNAQPAAQIFELARMQSREVA